MLDLRSLKYFSAAFEEQSISKAAKRCAIAQPSITLAIQNLEDQMSVRLFNRSRSGLTPTTEGRRLYPLAQSLLSQAQSISQEFTAQKLKEIHLYLQPDIHIETAGPLIHRLTAEWPEARLHLQSKRDDADIRLIEYQCKHKNEWFFPLWSETYVALLPPQSPLKNKAVLDLEDLQGVPLVERSNCLLYKRFKKVLQQKGIHPDIRAMAGPEESVLKLVELGIGAAIAPKSHARFAPLAIARSLREGETIRRQVGLACLATNTEIKALIKRIGPSLKEG